MVLVEPDGVPRDNETRTELLQPISELYVLTTTPLERSIEATNLLIEFLSQREVVAIEASPIRMLLFRKRRLACPVRLPFIKHRGDHCAPFREFRRRVEPWICYAGKGEDAVSQHNNGLRSRRGMVLKMPFYKSGMGYDVAIEKEEYRPSSLLGAEISRSGRTSCGRIAYQPQGIERRELLKRLNC